MTSWTRCTSGPTRSSAAPASSTRPGPGNVTIANAVGNGVADDKLLYTYVPDLIRYYLGEEPLLPNVESYRLDDPEMLDWVLGGLDQLVLKPVDGAGGSGIVIGPHADERPLAVLRAHVAARPRNWIAQRPVALSTVAGADRRAAGPAAHRPAAVRRQRRQRRVAAARRPDPGGAAGGRPRRQLQPGRRLQGHLGAGPASGRPRPCPAAGPAAAQAVP